MKGAGTNAPDTDVAMGTKDIALAALAFATPLVMWFGWAALMVVPPGVRKENSIESAVGTVLIVIAPLIGFGMIARSFRRWRDLDRTSKVLIVGMSCLYWLLYIPALYALWAVYVVGRAGGI